MYIDKEWDDTAKFVKTIGGDSDLINCLLARHKDEFALEDIKNVLAVIEGDNDGPDWEWVLALNDKRYVYLTGGCDYTGWG